MTHLTLAVDITKPQRRNAAAVGGRRKSADAAVHFTHAG